MQSGPASTLARGFTTFGLASAAAITGASAEQAPNKPVETVTVTARKVTLDVLPGQVLTAPQSINVIPHEVIQQQGVQNLQEALKNVPGITLNAGEGGTHGDLVNIRGFDAHDDFFLDGLRDTGPYTRDAFDLDSVEVYKGPASTLFGRGSTGGVVNAVTKAPQLFPIEDFTMTGGTNDEIRGTGDMNFVLGDDSALRIAAMGQISGVEDRPFAKSRRWGVAPSVAFGIDTDTTFTLKVLHEQEDNTPDYGIPFVFGRPAPVARNTYYGLPADDRSKTNVNLVTGRIDHTFNDVFSISDTARYGSYWFDSRQTAAIYGTANCYAGAAPYAGAPVCHTPLAPGENPVAGDNPLYPRVGTPLNQIFILRDRPSSTGVITTMMNNLNLTARFATGALTHTLVTGFEADSEFASLRRYVNQDDLIPAQPLLNPDPFQPFPGLHQTTLRQTPVTKTHTFAGVVTDTINIGEHWDFVGAVRFDHFGANFDQPLGATPTHFTHVDNVWSPRVAIVFKPDERSSLYVSYGTSFNPSAENLSLAANNAALPPEKDRTFEVGGKIQVLDHKLSLTAAAFDTKMLNARITDPLFPALQALAGTLTVRGVEFGAQGRITENWEIVAGYTFLDPSALGLVAAGVKGPIPNTAKHQGNVWTTYDFDNGFKLGAGINFIGTRFAGTDTLAIPGSVVVAKAPGYVTLDAMAGYQVTDNFGLQLNGYNLTDEYYYANSYFTRPNENHTVPGAGRTVMLSANISL